MCHYIDFSGTAILLNQHMPVQANNGDYKSTQCESGKSALLTLKEMMAAIGIVSSADEIKRPPDRQLKSSVRHCLMLSSGNK